MIIKEVLKAMPSNFIERINNILTPFTNGKHQVKQISDNSVEVTINSEPDTLRIISISPSKTFVQLITNGFGSELMRTMKHNLETGMV